jgi:hypothetical protein
MSQDLNGIKKWRTSDYIRPASIKAFLTVLLPQLTPSPILAELDF